MRIFTKLVIGAAMVLSAATAAVAPASAQEYRNYGHSSAYGYAYGTPLYAPHQDRNYDGNRGWAQERRQEFSAIRIAINTPIATMDAPEIGRGTKGNTTVPENEDNR